ncbi:MAG: PKD domain-containing protein, partial [Syntrophales bacterium]
MNVHRNLKKYLLLMLIALIFGAGMAFGSCPCNDVDQSVPNANVPTVSPSVSASASSLPAIIAVNNPPDKPTLPSGSSTGKIGRVYRYTTSAADPDGDKLKYTFDWGDGKTSVTRSVKPGTVAGLFHSWSKAGKYQVRVMATDSKGA